MIATVRKTEDGESIEAAGRSTEFGIQSILLDVADPSSIARAALQLADLVKDHGLYALVNNAGICMVGPTETLSLEQWRYQFEVNFFGALAVTQSLLPLLRQCKGAASFGGTRIVYINSVCGQVSTPLFGAYSASKFAQRALVDCQRLELRSHGVHVCSIVPGTIQSEIWRKEKEGVEALSHQARAHYGPMIENVADYVFRCATKALPADRVAVALEKCLNHHKPKPRYLVGWEAHVGAMARRLIPERVFNYLLAKTLGVP